MVLQFSATMTFYFEFRTKLQETLVKSKFELSFDMSDFALYGTLITVKPPLTTGALVQNSIFGATQTRGQQ